jgi:hypothetical protein
MRAVGLKVLKNKLSEYLRLAERGEAVLARAVQEQIAKLKLIVEVAEDVEVRDRSLLSALPFNSEYRRSSYRALSILMSVLP